MRKVSQGCSVKRLFLKFSQNSQGNTCAFNREKILVFQDLEMKNYIFRRKSEVTESCRGCISILLRKLHVATFLQLRYLVFPKYILVSYLELGIWKRQIQLTFRFQKNTKRFLNNLLEIWELFLSKFTFRCTKRIFLGWFALSFFKQD